MARPKYVVISPVRDEEAYLDTTARSMLNQTIRPAEWVIVDDGSTDGTGAIAEAYAARYPWIRTIHRADRGARVPGSGVVEAFYEGYDALKCQDWEYIVKLDGDVQLPGDYFERCFERFRLEPALGMCGGVMFRLEDGVQVQEVHPLLHVRGPLKLYRRACWRAIGGLLRAPGWDTVDEMQANRLGWRTRSLPELRVIHLRPTGAEQGPWRDAVKNGTADYITGYHPLFTAAKCIRRLWVKPYGIVALGHAFGYARGAVTRRARVPDAALVKYVRDQQLRRLLFRSSIWSEGRSPRQPVAEGGVSGEIAVDPGSR